MSDCITVGCNEHAPWVFSDTKSCISGDTCSLSETCLKPRYISSFFWLVSDRKWPLLVRFSLMLNTKDTHELQTPRHKMTHSSTNLFTQLTCFLNIINSNLSCPPAPSPWHSNPKTLHLIVQTTTWLLTGVCSSWGIYRIPPPLLPPTYTETPVKPFTQSTR